MIRTLCLFATGGLLLCVAGCSHAPIADAADAPQRENVAQRQQRPGEPIADGRYKDIKSPLIRSMLEALDGLTEDVTDEERGEHGKVREILLDADDELHRTLESDLTQKILDANKRPDPFQGKRPIAPQPTPVKAPEVRLDPVPPVEATPNNNAPPAGLQPGVQQN